MRARARMTVSDQLPPRQGSGHVGAHEGAHLRRSGWALVPVSILLSLSHLGEHGERRETDFGYPHMGMGISPYGYYGGLG
jgi:hypothetical protein